MDILRAENLCISFGGLAAVKNVSFTIPQNKIISLIGPNGAGKTTIFNIITGFYQADSGTVELCGEVINHISPERRIALGMARTFQNVRLFRQMTVLENVMIGNRRHIHYNVADGLLHTKKGSKAKKLPKLHAVRFWNESVCWMRKTSSVPTFLMANKKSWRSPARWQVSRGCSCLTNPQPA